MQKALCLAFFVYVSILGACNCQYNLGDGYIWKVPVAQDVWLEGPNKNYNDFPILIVGRHSPYPLKRSLVQFKSFTQCPANKIRWAKMYLYYKYAHKASWQSVSQTPFLSHSIEVHLVKRPWVESQATSTRNRNGYKWFQEYLALGRDAEMGVVGEPVGIYTMRPEGFIEFDVTRAVVAWRQGRPNYGLLLKVRNERDTGRDLRFFSRSYKDKAKHPVIHVMCDYQDLRKGIFQII